MAKQKKKKKHKAVMPPLSALDKVIYIVLIVLAILLVFAFGLMVNAIKYLIAYSDSTVIAYYAGAGTLLSIPTILLLLLVCIIPISDHFGRKTPIFGKKDITYGPPNYDAVYPIFMKNKSSVYVKPSHKKWCKTSRLIVLVLLVITLIPLSFSFCSRKCMTNDYFLQKYNAVNIKTAEYNLDEIENTSFRAYYDINVTSKSVVGFWTISIEFETVDNNHFQFDYSDFKSTGEDSATNTLNYLLDIKSNLNPDDIEYIGIDKLELVIEEKGFDENEAELLYELFSSN